MEQIPLDNKIVSKVVSESGIKSFSAASIREIARLVNLLEKATGVRYIRMEMGVPGLPAAKAGIDQMEFRLNNLKDEKMIAVLKALSGKFGYTPAKGPSGRGFGVACGTDVGTWVGVMVEVAVDRKTGHIKVVRASCAQDMGMCVNPQGTLLQIEGCITMGMGYSLTEELKFEGTRMLTQNYDTYEIPKFSWVPGIDAVILDRMDQPPHGGGEPAIICMGGAIASAVFDATGAVIYDMPITPERVLEALKKV